MSQDFTTRLQLQLREAALREEQRGAFGRRLAGLRYGMPAPAATVAVGLAALLVAVLIAVGGLRWGHQEDIVSNPKVIGNVPLAENLGFIASGFGSVWVADADRQVLLRVNPKTRAVEAEIRTGGDSNALGGDPIVNTGAGAVWAIARAPGADGGSRVLRIDPATNRITARATLPADQAPLVFDLQIVQGKPWVRHLRRRDRARPAQRAARPLRRGRAARRRAVPAVVDPHARRRAVGARPQLAAAALQPRFRQARGHGARAAAGRARRDPDAGGRRLRGPRRRDRARRRGRQDRLAAPGRNHDHLPAGARRDDLDPRLRRRPRP